jgi:DNA-directed RNA polymerase specialized sigma24 family protein
MDAWTDPSRGLAGQSQLLTEATRPWTEARTVIASVMALLSSSRTLPCQSQRVPAPSLALSPMSDDNKRDLPDEEEPEDEGPADAPRLTPADLEAQLRVPQVQARMKAAIREVGRTKLTDEDCEDLFQRASMRALRANRRPFVGGNTPAWFGRVASFETLDFLRKRAKEVRRLDRSKDAEERAEQVAADPLDGLDESETLQAWLRKRVAASEKETEFLEVLMRKAREKLTSAQAAKLLGITENAFDKRVQALKNKYAPARKRHNQRVRTFMLLLKLFAGAAVVVAIVLFAWWWLHRENIVRDPEERAPFKTRAAPSFDAAPPPTFDQALPPPEGSVGPK